MWDPLEMEDGRPQQKVCCSAGALRGWRFGSGGIQRGEDLQSAFLLSWME